jgi:hypothetical protein
MKIKVRANRHVVGLKRGQTGWVEDSRKVQSLIRVGYLVRIQEIELPLMSADFDDEPHALWSEVKEEREYGPSATKLVDYEPEYFRDYEDDADLALAESRLADDGGNRISLDDVLDRFGVTREELAQLDPDEEDAILDEIQESPGG